MFNRFRKKWLVVLLVAALLFTGLTALAEKISLDTPATLPSDI
jgi:hypothetical protein